MLVMLLSWFASLGILAFLKHGLKHRMDLRFLVGLTVLVDGDTDARVDRLTRACVAAKARRVVGNTFRGDRIVRITDTDGALTWQQ